MKITKLEIKNFYSIENITINFAKYKGVVFIDGINADTGGSNGSGKSAIIEALVWGLFGKTIRKSTEEALIANFSGKNMEVVVHVDDAVIRRTKKPTSLSFIVKENNLTREDAAATQQLIDAYLGTSYKVFLASVIFGQHNNLEFLSCTPDEKRTIIRNFLNLDEVFKLRDKIKDLKSEFNNTSKSKEILIKDYTKQREKFLKECSETILSDKEKQILNTYSLDDLLRREQLAKKLKEKELRCMKKKRFFSDILNTHLALTEKCELCGSLIEVDLVWKANKEARLKKQIAKLHELQTYYQQSLEKLPPAPSLQEFTKLKERAGKLEKQLFIEKTINDLSEKIDALNKEKQNADKFYDVMRFWERAFSEQGLIKYVIRNVLAFFNDKCNYYLSMLTDNNFKIKFDEEFTEEILNHGVKTQFISLSGGEKKKVNLAVILSLQNLLAINQKNKTNILFFDEIAESIDQEGINGLYILLTKLKKDHTIFVITHNEKLTSLLMETSKSLTIIKSKGISRLKKEV